MLIPRAIVIGAADASSPSYKAIKCARGPVTLDAHGIARATLAGNDNAGPTHPQYPRVVMAAAKRKSSRPANAPQRNGDPVNRQVASHPDRYASN